MEETKEVLILLEHPLDLREYKSPESFKIQLLEKIKDVLNSTDVHDWFVCESENYQKTVLRVNNPQSDR
ncbi:hypothetical protein [Flavobacterium anhuiense]|uniref:hypothetical protein n=1 Tax=Flavobacterium anhuiense TaxID=459526 RepID=UPI000E6CEE2E|nr:hypothetical protein [Flavobacterium anhuiense]